MANYLERIVYLNGTYLKGKDARISVFDRGFLFADSVYEGLGVLDGRAFDQEMHLDRLKSSFQKLNFNNPHSDAEYAEIFEQLISRNQVQRGFIYLQITRGEADRNFVYGLDVKPNVLAFIQPHGSDGPDKDPLSVTMRSHIDLRWKRRDIKTTNLLGQVIAKANAHAAGDYEALLIDDEGFVTEGGASSFFIVKGDQLFARPADNNILHGITRRAMLRVADEMGLEYVVRKFQLEEALAADEAILTGSSSYIQAVVQIDGQKIGTGEPGRFTRLLYKEYLRQIRHAAPHKSS